jgi:hypothetical protein
MDDGTVTVGGPGRDPGVGADAEAEALASEHWEAIEQATADLTQP